MEENQVAPVRQGFNSWDLKAPFYAFGTIHLDAVEGKIILVTDHSTHPLNAVGHRWRWNIKEQCWCAPRGRSELTADEECLVMSWLNDNCYHLTSHIFP